MGCSDFCWFHDFLLHVCYNDKIQIRVRVPFTQSSWYCSVFYLRECLELFLHRYCILVASVGISFLQFTNMNTMRNLIITGLSLFLGISIPQFFNDYWNPPHHGLVHTNAGWFNVLINTVFLSLATVALIVAVFLDNTLEVEKSKKDRGMTWWAQFKKFKGDSRNEEFYTLPFNLNRFFPPT